MNRKGWEPNTSCRVCSDHFVTGWHWDNRDDGNYRPTLFPYKRVTDVVTERSSRAFRSKDDWNYYVIEAKILDESH